MKIKKRNGKEEEFYTKKAFHSILKAGASEELARKVSSGITPHKGITTSEVRGEVLKVLTTENQDAAKNFESYKKS